MKVLVVGGAGYVGSHCVKHLVESGDDVLVYDNLSAGHGDAVRGCELVIADLADLETLDRVMLKFKPDGVMHFAASLFPRESTQKPLKYYRNNVANTIGLLETMAKRDVKRLVFSSTCAVYGNPPGAPVREDMPTAPISPYGRSKLMMEQVMADCAAAWGLGFAALRYFNAAGAARDGAIGEDHAPEIHLIPLIIAAAMGKRDAIEIYGTDYNTPDGSCVRDYIHVDDLATAHLKAFERIDGGRTIICNLGTGRGSSVREVINAVRKVSGKDFEVRESERRDGDPEALYADPTLAREALDWQPAVADINDVVASAWRWHSTHPEGFAE